MWFSDSELAHLANVFYSCSNANCRTSVGKNRIDVKSLLTCEGLGAALSASQATGVVFRFVFHHDPHNKAHANLSVAWRPTLQKFFHGTKKNSEKKWLFAHS